MGDFTWHTSDPDHALVNMEPTAGLPAPFNTPVYLLAPDGRKWREDNYEGYGVFGGAESGAELARWNFPASATVGRTELQLHRDSVQEQLFPYGGGDYGRPAPVFPLKFTRNPDATYDELPPSIPAGGETKYLSLTDFDVVLADGTVISGEGWVDTSPPVADYSDPEWWSKRERSGHLDALGIFWMDRIKELGLVKEGDIDPDAPFDVVFDIFGDTPEELTLPDGASMVYTAWKQSVHEVFRGVMFGHWLNDLRIIKALDRLQGKTDTQRLAVMAELFDAGVAQGREDYDREASVQVGLYERNQPMAPAPLYGSEDVLEIVMASKFDGANITDEDVLMMGRKIGANDQNLRNTGFLLREDVKNPFRVQ